MRSLALFLVLVAAASIPASAQEPPESPPSPSFQIEVVEGAEALSVEGATPGGDVVLLGVGRQTVGYLPTTIRYERRVEASDLGEAEIALGETVPFWSVWTAVDLATGAVATGWPEGAPVQEVERPAQGLGATAQFIEDSRRWVEFLLVRPEMGPGDQPNPPEEVGAWGLTLGDGGDDDRDGETNGAVRLSLLDLRPLGDDPPSPERLAPGDVVLGVDGETLGYYAVRLAAPGTAADDEGVE